MRLEGYYRNGPKKETMDASTKAVTGVEKRRRNWLKRCVEETGD